MLSFPRLAAVSAPRVAVALCTLASAPMIKGHDTVIHNRMRGALLRLARQYLRVPVAVETRVPFLHSPHPGAELLRMDLVLPDHSFPLTAFHDPARNLPRMVDVSCIEVQCASNVQRAAKDPAALCSARQSTKKKRYSRHFDANCYTLVTAAFGSFGVIG